MQYLCQLVNRWHMFGFIFVAYVWRYIHGKFEMTIHQSDPTAMEKNTRWTTLFQIRKTIPRFPFNGIVIKRKRRQIRAFNNRHDCWSWLLLILGTGTIAVGMASVELHKHMTQRRFRLTARCYLKFISWSPSETRLALYLYPGNLLLSSRLVPWSYVENLDV